MWRMVKAVLILPCTAVVLVPGGIYWATAGLTYAGRLSSSGQIQFWVGLAAMGVGLALGFWTASLFVRVGQGTPAPWDPPKNLVVRGPYRHVRNPMISSVLFMLLGEALIFQSWPIGGWGCFFSPSILFTFSSVKKSRWSADSAMSTWPIKPTCLAGFPA